MTKLETAADIASRLVPAIRDGTHNVVMTDHDAGYGEIAVYSVALGVVGVPADALLVTRFDVMDPTGRSVRVAVLAVAKAETPARFMAYAAAARGNVLQPGQDMIAISADPLTLIKCVFGMVEGKGRMGVIDPTSN